MIAGRDEGKLERARAQTPALHTLTLDVTFEQDASDAIARLESEFAGLDMLVNSAGRFRGYPFAAATAAEYTRTDFEVNVVGSLRMTRLALPLLRASDGGAVAGFSVYAATKAAVHSAARSLRAELKPSGIRVVEVLPPVVDTDAAGELDVAKLSTAAVAEAIARGLERDREEIRVGSIRQLAPLARLAPRLADRLVARALASPR